MVEDTLGRHPVDYGALFAALPNPYLLLAPDSPQFTIVGVNDAYLRATEQTRDELVGRGLFEVFPDNPDDPAADGVANLRASLERALSSRSSDAMAIQKYDILNAEGHFEERFWSPVNTAVHDTTGVVSMIIHHVEDVTDYVRIREHGEERRHAAERLEAEAVAATRRLAEANDQLRQTSSLLQLVGDSTPDLICAKDRQSRLLYANAAFERAIGRPRNAFLGKDDREFTSDPKQAEINLAHDRRVIETGETLDVDEIFTSPDGETRCYRSVKAPMRDASGAIIGLVGVTSDVTARREAEEREQLLAREVDHRAKNVLAVVQSVVQLTRADDATALKNSIIGRVQSLGRTHSLLAAGRWEGVDVGQLVAEELAPFVLANQNRVRTGGPAIRVKPAAAQALALVLHELATNAVKYGSLSTSNGRLEVTWLLAPEMLGERRLELKWEESDGPEVTAPTRRGFGSTVIRTSIERQLKGSLSLEWPSTGLSCGITVPGEQLLLPNEATARPLSANEDEPKAGGLSGWRILAVEDEPLIALNLEQALTEAGCATVTLVQGVAAALERIESEKFEGAVLDINLGAESSFPVAHALAERGIPFAFCTGYTGYIDVPERHSRAPVLSKPFRTADLTRALWEMRSSQERQGTA